MSVFNSFSASDRNLFEHRVSQPYWQEILVNSDFSMFSGNTPNQIIYKKSEPKGRGDTMTFGMGQTYFPNVIFGSDAQISGTGDKLVFSNDKVTVDQSAFLINLTAVDMDEIRVNIDLSPIARSTLYKKGKLAEKCKIMNQFGLAFYGDTIRIPDCQYYRFQDWATTIIPQMLACTVNNAAAASTISTDRVIFGADRAAQATVGASVANGILASNDDDALTVDHIYKLVELANAGGRVITGHNEMIEPYESTPLFGFINKTYILFTSPQQFNRLRNTDDWKSQVTRGVIEAKGVQPSTLYNMFYKGEMIGVKVIVYPEWDAYNFLNADGSTVGYSALCGASAIIHGIGKEPWITTEERNHERENEIAMNMIEGMRVVKFASKSDSVLRQNNPIRLERGLIHSFTMINRV